MPSPTWVLDSSSLISVRTQTSREAATAIYQGMVGLVAQGRLMFPAEVLTELKKYAGPENPALEWALSIADRAGEHQPDYRTVKQVLKAIPEVLDVRKEGEDEADPYVVAMALEQRSKGISDIRVVTDDVKATGLKMSLAAGAGFFGLPSVPMRVFAKFEGFSNWG